MSFKKTTEDFNCENCGNFVVGNGYTNHCPKCLWSKHVDVYPGDRAASCGGMMKPAGVVKESDDFVITHICERCNYQKRNKVSKGDDFDVLLLLVV